MTVRMRTRPRATRHNQSQIAFQASSLQALSNVKVSNLQLVAGRAFEIELRLRFPVAQTFNLAGAEAIFRSAMPPGLELVDVRGVGSNTVIIDARVLDVAPAAQTATLSIAPVVIAIAGFIGAHWLGLSLAGIGLFILLGPLINQITGRTDFASIGDVAGLAKWAAIGLSALVGLNAIRTVRT